MPEESLTYHELAQAWKALRATHDVRVREVACVGAARTLLCAEIGESDRPCVHLTAGTHGDEPAGVVALLQAAGERDLDPAFAYRIWPCTNPTGFDARTRESDDGVDVNRTFGRGGSSPESKAIVMANRDRKFALAVDLHEDDEADGFYAYTYGDPRVAEAALKELRARNVAVDARGLIVPDPAAEAEAIGGLSLSLLLCRNAAQRTITFESASRAPFPARVAAHRVALTGAIGWLRDSQTTVK
jgi:protein MpaA